MLLVKSSGIVQTVHEWHGTLGASPRMPRHIRELFLCAGAKIHNLLKVRVITKNAAKKRPSARTFFCFTDILISLAK